MSKRSKEIALFAVAFVAFFIAPSLLLGYFNNHDTQDFYRYMAEDNETCRQRAKEDARETEWCSEIRKAATLAYTEGKYTNKSQFLLLMFQPLLFALFYTLYNLRKQVEELKGKIDA